MSDPVRFLNAFAQALGVMTLYPEGHPSRERAVDIAFGELEGITDPGGHPTFTFLDDEVVLPARRQSSFSPLSAAAAPRGARYRRRATSNRRNTASS